MNKFILAFCLPFFLSCTTGLVEETQEAIIIGQSLENLSAAVVCAHPEAAKIGAEILKKGGNAIDAAVATHWALAVCFPRAGNIGGGGFMVYRDSSGKSHTLDFREMAPGRAHADMYLDSTGNIIDGLSLDTELAAGVPGSVAGMYEMHNRFGRLPMEQLIAPAIVLAEKGFKITEDQAGLYNAFAEVLYEKNSFNPFYKEQGWSEGDVLFQPQLAITLRKISETKGSDFYEGTIAQLIVDAMGQKGIIQPDDLRAYRPIWRDPFTIDYGDYTIITMPPPSSGGVAMAQLFGMLRYYNPDSLEHNSLGYIHLLVELERRAYADRSEYLGDPDFYNVPYEALLDTQYLWSSSSNILPYSATPSALVKAGDISLYESTETTHLSVVDKEGNAVSITTTLNGNFGSGILVKEAGFFLNNEMDDFSSKPGEPNMFGLVGGRANAIEPRKRMLSSMTPSIVEKNGDLFLVLGSPGGSTIITSVFQTIMNATVFEMGLDSAIAAPKFHSQWLPDLVFLEKDRFEEIVIDSLGRRGHSLSFFESLGRVNAVMISENGEIHGCGDPRGENYAAGIKVK